MLRAFTRSCAPTLAAAVLAAAAGCAEKTPEERVAALRARYSAELNGYVVREEPLAAAAAEAAGTAAGEVPEAAPSAAEAGGAEGEAPMAEGPPVRQDAILDILVRHDSPEKLPGLTLDISLAGPDEQEKDHWQVWVDTSRIERGPGVQITHVLEDVPYEPGDGFHVEVRDISPGERSAYREFARAN